MPKRAMRATAIVLALLVPASARAESAGQALKEFGIVGTWSPDCALTGKEQGQLSLRMSFEVPFFGTPKLVTTITASRPGGETGKSVIPSEIESALKVTEEKLKIGMVQGAVTINGKEEAFEGTARRIEFVIEKAGSKIRMPGLYIPASARGVLLEKCLN